MMSGQQSKYQEEKPRKAQATADRLEEITDLVIFSQDIYCGGYSGEDPPLPIPNREVKLTIADGTAPPGGRVGSCHFLLEALRHTSRSFFVVCIVLKLYAGTQIW